MARIDADARDVRLFTAVSGMLMHGVDICLGPTSGGKADMLGGPRCADCVAKVFLHW
jgi:hypothetical protein